MTVRVSLIENSFCSLIKDDNVPLSVEVGCSSSDVIVPLYPGGMRLQLEYALHLADGLVKLHWQAHVRLRHHNKDWHTQRHRVAQVLQCGRHCTYTYTYIILKFNTRSTSERKLC